MKDAEQTTPPPKQPTEEQLVERAKNNDEQALTLLIRQFGPAVRAHIASRVPKKHQAVLSADDVMQQTYADVALGLHRFEYRGEGSFAAWLKKLAERTLFDAIKMLDAAKRGGNLEQVHLRSGEGTVLATIEIVARTHGTPSRCAARNEREAAFYKALHSLPPDNDYRRVIEMYGLEERPIEEVATELGRSIGATRMLYSRAQKHIEGVLGSVSKYMTDADTG